MENRISYSKHKENSPEKTIDRIQHLLREAGIETEIAGEMNHAEQTFSNRITVKGLPIGTNGKGMNRIYALASGHAEFMERLENGMLASQHFETVLQPEFGFYHHPDEILGDAEEYAHSCDETVQQWFQLLEIDTDSEKQQFLKDLSVLYYGRTDGKIPLFPFYDEFAKKTVFLPGLFTLISTGTNGMAAGNTMQEAAVQGLSELYERYVQMEIVTKNLTPPQIPRQELRYCGIDELIQTIEESGRYRIRVFDCSLGKGFPVAATMIIDQQEGTFGLRFGAHPSFAVALERTLTESFQGIRLEDAASWCRIGSREEVLREENIDQLIHNSMGLYQTGLFFDTPDWEYVSWSTGEHADNRTMLEGMLALLKQNGMRILFRDNSWLGFPACELIVPGISEVSLFNASKEEILGNLRVRFQIMNHFPLLQKEEQHFLKDALKRLVVQNGITGPAAVFHRPMVPGVMSPEKLLGFLSLEEEEYALAKEMFTSFGSKVISAKAKSYWHAMGYYCALRNSGESRESAIHAVQALYALNTAQEAETDTKYGAYRHRFPKMNCYDCERCQVWHVKVCQGKEELEFLRKVKAAAARTHITQHSLL